MKRLLQAASISAAIIGMSALCSCDSAIYDGQGDCSVQYRIGLRYTKNILDADAFGSQVTDIALFVYNTDGTLVLRKDEKRELTTENNFYINLDLKPGKYNFLAWCAGESVIPDATAFELENTAGLMSESAAVLPLEGDQTNPVSNRDIKRFYHGISTDVTIPDTYGTVNLDPISLTKDTNHLSILLQNIDGKNLDPAIFTFELEGHHNELDYLNNPYGNTAFTYKPWSVESSSASFDNEDNPDAGRSVAGANARNGILAEMTTSRLMANEEQYLTIKRNDTGQAIIRIPLIKYLLLVRSKYEEASDNQNYLDRYDDFTLMFFIEEGFTWAKAKIYINGWRVVPPQDENL